MKASNEHVVISVRIVHMVLNAKKLRYSEVDLVHELPHERSALCNISISGVGLTLSGQLQVSSVKLRALEDRSATAGKRLVALIWCLIRQRVRVEAPGLLAVLKMAGHERNQTANTLKADELHGSNQNRKCSYFGKQLICPRDVLSASNCQPQRSEIPSAMHVCAFSPSSPYCLGNPRIHTHSGHNSNQERKLLPPPSTHINLGAQDAVPDL
eukprot:2784100-Amphidinium_carterae.1